MSKNPRVSVVCISYNQEKYIAAALDGFIRQEVNFELEVIISDDASTDKTQKIISEYATKYPEIIKPILRKKNIGAIANFLDALHTARGSYIALCEGDDYWTDPMKLQKQVAYMDENPECSVLFHRVKVIYQTKEHENYIFPDVTDVEWYTNEELLRTNYIPTNSVMYRRQNYDNLPKDVMPFDWFLHLYHANFGKVRIIDEVMSVYRKHKAGMWWDYDTDRDKTWRKYGLSYLALFLALEKVYKGKPEALTILKNNLYNILAEIIEIDDKYDDGLFVKAIQRARDHSEGFMIDRQRKLGEKNAQVQTLTSELLGVGDERNLLRLEVANLKNELSKIKHTKTWRFYSIVTNIINRILSRFGS